MGEMKTRGSVLNGYLKFIRWKWGTMGENACHEALGIPKDSIREEDWYPQKVSQDILSWISATKGRDHVAEAGGHTVQNLGVLAYMVRFANMELVLKNAHRRFHDAFSYGDVDVEMGKGEAWVRMKDTAVDENACIAWLGAYKGMLSMTRTKGTVVEEQCQRKGASRCVFHIKWE